MYALLLAWWIRDSSRQERSEKVTGEQGTRRAPCPVRPATTRTQDVCAQLGGEAVSSFQFLSAPRKIQRPSHRPLWLQTIPCETHLQSTYEWFQTQGTYFLMLLSDPHILSLARFHQSEYHSSRT